MNLSRATDPPLVVILGATAVGKTSLSLALCARFHGEVVSADSRQIYRGMDIGTAKASSAEQAAVPHHLLDIRNPDQAFTVAEYQALAYSTIDEIHARGRTPFLVGGTALYARAVIEGLRIPQAPPNPSLRRELEAYLAQHGRDALFARLEKLDPLAAAAVDPLNHRRVLRALEIYLTTGRSKVELESKYPPPYRILRLGLRRPRESLHTRIAARVAQMLDAGLVDEVQRLLDAGYAPHLPAMTSLGYREVVAYLQGELARDAMAQRIITETNRYVRHQETWFRRMEGVTWYDVEDPAAAAAVANDVARFLRAG